LFPYMCVLFLFLMVFKVSSVNKKKREKKTKRIVFSK
jgi:hypothetical protein